MYDETGLKEYLNSINGASPLPVEKFPQVSKLLKGINSKLDTEFILKGKIHTSGDYNLVMQRKDGSAYVSFVLCHYTGCCGACFIAGISSYTMMSDTIKIIIDEFCQFILRKMNYSQISYQVKDQGQGSIRIILDFAGFKVVSSFRNKRTNNLIHTMVLEG